MVKKIIHIVMAAAAIVLLAYCFMLWQRRDTTKPEIFVSDETLVYLEGDPISVLLEGVLAEDDRDADITERVGIGRLSQPDGNGKAEIEYRVFDKSGNMASAKREIIYIPVTEEETEEETEEDLEKETEETTEEDSISKAREENTVRETDGEDITE